MNTQAMALPASLAGRQRRSLMDDMANGLGGQRGAHISIAGGKFHIVNAAGQKYLVPTHHLDLIFVDVNPNTSRVYFDPNVPYDPGASAPPLCFSDNGTGPSKDAIAPQSPTCVICPKNDRNSGTTFTGKPTTACDKRKKFGVIMPNQPDVQVYEFTVPPGSLSNLKAYSEWLRQQATGGDRPLDIADMITRVEWDDQRPFIMTFRAAGWADDERTVQMIEYIDANHLSDVAVNRADTAIDPNTFRQLAAPQSNVPVAPAAPQQFALPPRASSPAAVAAAPPLSQTPPMPPRRRRSLSRRPPSPPGSPVDRTSPKRLLGRPMCRGPSRRPLPPRRRPLRSRLAHLRPRTSQRSCSRRTPTGAAPSAGKSHSSAWPRREFRRQV